MLHVLTCMLHVLTCMLHLLTCMLHVLTCMLHVLTCMLHVLTCMLHVPTCNTSWHYWPVIISNQSSTHNVGRFHKCKMKIVKSHRQYKSHSIQRGSLSEQMEQINTLWYRGEQVHQSLRGAIVVHLLLGVVGHGVLGRRVHTTGGGWLADWMQLLILVHNPASIWWCHSVH